MIRFPFIRPDVPPIAAWAPILQAAYEAKRFSNFGPLSRRLEAFMAAAWGCPETSCVAAANGTVAIAAPLIAAGVTGRVLLPAFTFPGTLSAIRMAGAEPFLLDVSADDWRVSAETLARGLEATGSGSAVLLAPFGMRRDFRPHAEIIARRGGILVIDNASGLGVARQQLERLPHCFEAYSLHATKPFAVGEGGMIFGHHEWEERLRRSLNFGLAPGRPSDLEGWGVNGKLSEVHAAIGLAAAETFADRLTRRRALVGRYGQALTSFADVRACIDPDDGAWQSFPFLLPTADAASRFTAAAEARGMETRQYYVPALSTCVEVDRLGPCPVAEDLAKRMCCVPVYSDATAIESDELLAIFQAALGEA